MIEHIRQARHTLIAQNPHLPANGDDPTDSDLNTLTKIANLFAYEYLLAVRSDAEFKQWRLELIEAIKHPNLIIFSLFPALYFSKTFSSLVIDGSTELRAHVEANARRYTEEALQK